MLGVHRQKRAKEEIARAQGQGIPVGALSETPLGKRFPHGPGEQAAASDDGGARARDTGAEATGPDAVAKRNGFNLVKIVQCREKPRLAWLHLPYVELVFMMFAFEGAVACQVSTIRDNVSPLSFFLALATFVSSMLKLVFRSSCGCSSKQGV